MSKPRVLITGGRGMLGSALARVLSPEYEVLSTDIDTVDITDAGAVKEVTGSFSPGLIIHCAAYTNVDGAETDKELAFRTNAFGTRNVAAAANEAKVPLLYVSTDYVFDGKKTEPYLEFDKPNPANVYGASKLAGEDFVRNICSGHYIVRTAWLYGRGGKNFVDSIISLAEKNGELRVVNDQRGSPTYADDLAGAILIILRKKAPGLYHVTNSGSCSWFEFAREIVNLWGMKDVTIIPISSAESARKAARPSNSILENYNLRRTTGFVPRHWKDALKDYLRLKREK